MNPFEINPAKNAELILNWEKLRQPSYDKRAVDPYTRARIILMNGTEFENVWFSHRFSRAIGDNDLRRRLALIRRSEQQQQKLIAHLKPPMKRRSSIRSAMSSSPWISLRIWRRA